MFFRRKLHSTGSGTESKQDDLQGGVTEQAQPVQAKSPSKSKRSAAIISDPVVERILPRYSDQAVAAAQRKGVAL